MVKLMSADWFGPWSQDDLYTMASGLLKIEVYIVGLMLPSCVLIHIQTGNLDFSLSVDPICQMLIYMHGYASSLCNPLSFYMFVSHC